MSVIGTVHRSRLKGRLCHLDTFLLIFSASRQLLTQIRIAECLGMCCVHSEGEQYICLHSILIKGMSYAY